MSKKLYFIVFLAGILSACGGGSSSGGTDNNDETNSNNIETQQVDASSRIDYVYYRFQDNGLTEVSLMDPSIDTEWDIAFRRTSILLNGGAFGPGAIGGSLAVMQDQFYNNDGSANSSVFLNATAANEGQTAFEKTFDLNALLFATDSNSGAVNSDWYIYSGPPAHTLTVNPDRYWVIRSSAGDSYAKFRVTELTTVGRALSSITIGIDVQAVGAGAFSGTEMSQTIDLSASESVCYDFDNSMTSDCSDSSWDLRFDTDFEIWLNSDVYGNGQAAIAFGAVFEETDSTFVNLVDGTTVTHWVRDETAGTFDDDSWYAYNLQGQHQLWPNYRVYIIQDGDQHYKLQILSYYSEQNVGAHLSVKVEAL